MATALGQILEIDKETIDNIASVSTNIGNIADASEKAANAFNEAFERMKLGATGLNEVLIQIKENIQATGLNMSGLTQPMQEAEKKVDDSARKITDAIKSIAEFDVSNSSIAQLGAQIRKVESVLTKGKGMSNPLEEQELVNYLATLKQVYKERMTSEQRASELSQKESENRMKQAQRETSTILAEIERQRTAYLRLEEQRMKAEEKGYNKPAATVQQQTYYTSLVEQVKATEKELSNLEKKYSDIAKVGHEAFTLKQVQMTVEHQNRLADAASREAKERERSYKAAERNRKAAEREYEIRLKEQRSTVSGSLAYAQQAKTFNERAQAIKYLETAMKNLDSTNKDYAKNIGELSAAHKKLTEEQKTAAQAMGTFKENVKQVSSIASKLAPLLASIFSTRAIVGFTKKLIEVRGELELQNVALASILSNKEKADQLFSQITQLAVQSPFTIRQLTTYTKQLAAYQVEFKKLFPVTKQLADVAAGLGVDMGRLILAYGQVKAANYLRATEVRQFTEAGINILGELAEYYSKLEGNMVTVADVQERITKRMVEFGDVEKVFQKITSAGGLFYQMQERQAETLRGMMMNLQDSMDLMLNDIGKKNEGIMKASISSIKFLMDHYGELFQIIKAVGIGYGSYWLTTTKAYAATKAYIQALSQYGIVSEAIKVHFFNLQSSVAKVAKSFGAFIKANWVLLAVVAAATALYETFNYLKKRSEELDKSIRKTNNSLANLTKITDSYNELRTSIDDASDSQTKFNRKFAELTELNKLMTDFGFTTLFDKNKEGLTVPIKLGEISKDNIDSVFSVSSDILERATIFGGEIRNAITEGLTGAEGSVFGAHLFGDNLQSDAEQLGRRYASLISGGFTVQLENMISNLVVQSENLGESYKGRVDELSRGIRAGETEVEWRMRALNLINQIISSEGIEYKQRQKYSKFTIKYLSDITSGEREFGREVDKVIDKVAKQYGGLENLVEYAKENPLAVRTAIDNTLAEQQWTDYTKDFARRRLYAPLYLTPVIEDTDTEGLTGYAKFIDEIQKKSGLKIIQDTELKKITNLVEASEMLNKVLKERRDALEKIQGSTATVEGATKTAEEETKEYTSAIEVLVDILKQLGLKEEGGKYGGKNTANEILKERIDLLKQIRQEYEQNRKVMGEEEASAFTKSQFKDNAIFQQLQKMGVIDATLNVDSTGLITALRRLAAQSGDSARREIEAMIATLNNEQVVISIQADFEGVKDELENLFDRVEITKQMEKLGLDKSIVEQLFGVESLAVENVNDEIEKIARKYVTEMKEATKTASENAYNYDIYEIEKVGDFIKQHENIKLYAYDDKQPNKDIKRIEDVLGTATIGWGHTAGLTAQDIVDKYTITREQAEEFFEQDIVQFTSQLNSLLENFGLSVSEKQYEALLSLTYNAGAGATKELLERANGDFEKMAEIWEDNFRVKSKYKDEYRVMEGLVKRRQEEVALFREGAEEVQNLTKQTENYEHTLASTSDEFWESFRKLIGEEQFKVFQQQLEKSEDLHRKALEERLKNYAKYLKMEASVAVQAKLDEARQLAELEATSELTEPQKEVIRTRIKEETREKVDKSAWDQFKNTDMYIRMFEDLDFVSTSALTNMENKLISLRDSLKNLDPQNLKEIENQLQKIQEAKMQKSPLQSMIDSMKEMNALRKEGLTPEVLQEQSATYQMQADAAQQEIDALEYLIGLRDKGMYVESEQLALEQGRLDLVDVTTDRLREQVIEQKNIKKEAETNLETAGANLDTYKKARKSIESYGKAMSDFGGEISGLLGDVSGLIQDITGESSDVLDTFADITGIISESASAVITLTALFTAMGIALDTSLGIIGYIIIALKAVIAIVSAIVNANDKQLEASIERSKDKVDELERSYEKLEEAINDAYDAGKLQAYNREMENTLKLEKQEIENQIALYKARKGGQTKYSDEIKELKDARDEIDRTLKENEERLIEKMGGFGSASNIASAAESFVDAWYDAFMETGDGLTALEGKFDEFIDNLVKRQAIAKIASKFLEPLFEAVDEAVAEGSAGAFGGLEVTRQELDKIIALAGELIPNLNENLKAMMESLGVTPGTAGTETGLSGLAEDYGQMTEATATVLASINESIRYFESDSNLVLHNIQNILTVPGENPFYLTMLEQARYTKEIRDALNAMTFRDGMYPALMVRTV